MKQSITYVIVSLLTILSLSQCSPKRIAQRKLSRAINLIDEAKKLDPKIRVSKIDSIDVTITTPEIRVDSTFTAEVGKKTILKKGNLTISHELLPNGDTKLEGVVAKDTVTTKVAVENDILIERITGYRSFVKNLLGVNELVFWLIHLFVFLFFGLWVARRIGIW
jgi:hypothetical protein